MHTCKHATYFILVTVADSVDWSLVYESYCKDGGKMDRCIDFADVGCGFGGLLIELGRNYPDKVSIGIEIREKVSSYVDQVRSPPALDAFRYSCPRTCWIWIWRGGKFLSSRGTRGHPLIQSAHADTRLRPASRRSRGSAARSRESGTTWL